MADNTNPNATNSKTTNFLPQFYRTDANKKFLQATLDQLVQPGAVNKVNGFVGRQYSKATTGKDIFVNAESKMRQDYQLEPGVVVNDESGNTTFFKDYQDYINQLGVFGSNTTNHARINNQEFYSWDPHIAWDKFVNFQQYYWLPYGPDTIDIVGQQRNIISKYTVEVESELENNAFLLTPDGLTRNATITLYRGQTYEFEVNSPLNPFTIKITQTLGSADLYSKGVTNNGIQAGTLTFTVPNDCPDVLFYVSSADINMSGTIIVKSIVDNTYINVNADIIGKKTYTLPDGTPLSNGMKVRFRGTVEPSTYATGLYYVEGVGTNICLVHEKDLEVISSYTSVESIPFDNTPFDTYPFSDASSYAKTTDYIVVSRSSKDRNPWSRYNRWFHKSVIETSAKLNGKVASVDQSARAIRPIIEFNPNIKLFNFGTYSVPDVDLIDTSTTDAMSVVEGSFGYIIDGVKISDGMRVLFTADTDLQVKNKIYKVKFVDVLRTITSGISSRQIHLVPQEDPAENQVILIKQGVTNQGAMYWYNGSTWALAQQKSSLNQAPLFDVFDSNNISFSDATVYTGSTFKGTRLFSYKESTTGSNDPVLNFPLTYKSIYNIGDIVFNFDLVTDSFTYKGTSQIFNRSIGDGFLLKSRTSSQVEYVNGWKQSVVTNVQPGVRIYKNSNQLNNFDLDIFDDINNLSDLNVRVYINGIAVDKTLWSIIDSPVYKKIVLATDILSNDVLTIKAFAKQPINSNGFYEMPINLQNNPLNGVIPQFTLGEIGDHVRSIVENNTEFTGTYPGVGNLNDLGNISAYGTKFVQHSGPLSLSMYHITSEGNNVIRAIETAQRDYNKFKRTFIRIAETLGVDTNTVDHFSLVMSNLHQNNNTTAPYYFSDMLGYTGAMVNDFTVLDYRIKKYPLSDNFTLDTLSKKAVYVYLNGLHLIRDKDYTFDGEGYIEIIADIAEDDVIRVYEYESTDGSLIPATPTKLGIWPAYEPKIYKDTSLITPRWMIQGHDGSQTLAYGDYDRTEAGYFVTEDFRDRLLLELEYRIFNNIKIKYDPSVFDIHDFIPGYHRDTDYSLTEFNEILAPQFYKWSSAIDKDFTKPLGFDKNDPFSFNFRNYTSPDGRLVPGYWRGIYRWMLDTDRPNICPWECLGFTVEPMWWQEVYGPAPYTSNNLILWEDIAAGVVREPGKPLKQLKKYIRPILSKLPVDENGDLLNPMVAGMAKGNISDSFSSDFVFGDMSPIESAWRRSSNYPFAVIVTMLLMNPAKTFGLALDRSRIIRNMTGQLVYKETGLRVTPRDIVFPTTYDSTERVLASGIINYIVDYIVTETSSSLASYKYDMAQMTCKLSYRIGAFTSKEKFNLLLDSRSPTSSTVFVPPEDYDIILNVSSPVTKVTYSGVIVSKLADGYTVQGYSKTQPYFKYYDWSKDGPLVNVGGVSESFVVWTNGKTYASGQVVYFNNRYYRAKITHTATLGFDVNNFQTLEKLPIIGGKDAFFRIGFDKETIITIPYGTKFRTVQDVVDFLLGYGEYLKDQGFVFDDFNATLAAVTNWQTSAKEFLFWTTQNWSSGEDKWKDWMPDEVLIADEIVRYDGEYYKSLRSADTTATFQEDNFIKLDGLSSVGSSVISLSPAAIKLTFTKALSIVDDINNQFNGYEIFQVNGTPIPPNLLSSYRDANTVSYTPRGDLGIYSATFYLVQKEQVVILNNETMFNDTIYNLATGYKQDRIKVAGYVTSGWNGSFSAPGFIFDQAQINNWTPWKDYNLGDIVKYKEFYYASTKFLAGASTFDSTSWTKLTETPQPQLLPNWSYKASQFTDFYSLDSDNFDVNQQKMAQHAIGYQKRQYLSNIIQDDVSEFKFYQGMIIEKGTQNSLTKLFDVLSADGKDSINFYEEWAVRVGQYGASSAFENIEFKLDESLFKGNPQTFELVSSVDNTKVDFVIRQTPNDVYLKPSTYNNNPWPIVENYQPFLRTPGYVRESDVKLAVPSLDDILAIDNNDFMSGDYVWVGFEGPDWNVYRYSDSNISVIDAIYDPVAKEITIVAPNLVPLSAGDIIGITQVSKFSGFYKVLSVSLNQFVISKKVDSWQAPFTEQLSILIFNFTPQRTNSIDTVNGLLPPQLKDANRANSSELVWTDDGGNGKWAVWQHNQVFDKTLFKNNDPSNNQGYGRSVAVNSKVSIMGVSTATGEVVIYDKVSGPQAPWIRRETLVTPFISNDEGLSNPNTARQVAEVLAMSDTGDWLAVGSPTVSHVSWHYTGTFNPNINYNEGDVVKYNNKFWKVINSLVPTNSVPSLSSTYWEIKQLYNTSKYKGTWSATTVYTVGDVVKYQNEYWAAVDGLISSGITPFAPSTHWVRERLLTVRAEATNSSLTAQGTVSLYKKDINNIYTLTATFTSPNPSNNEQFGSSIAFSDNIIFIGANGYNNNNGIIYKMHYDTTVETSSYYNPLGSADTTIIVSKDNNIQSGMAVNGTGFTSGQIVNAVINADSQGVALPYTKLILSAAPDSEPSGLLEFTTVGWEYGATITNNTPTAEFGKEIAVSTSSSRIITSAPGTTTVGKVFIYSIDSTGATSLYQTITGTDTYFGKSIAVSSTGEYIAIGSTLSDGKEVDQGKVYVYKNNGTAFELVQTLESINPEAAGYFGTKVSFMNGIETIVVFSLNIDSYTDVTFDNGTTVFDKDVTMFKTRRVDNGQIDVFDKYNNTWVFSERLANSDTLQDGYAAGFAVANNLVIVGVPYAQDQDVKAGKVYEYRKQPGTKSWTILRSEANAPDISKIKKVFLYNKKTNKVVSYLDVLDPVQGKIPGIAEQELKYKTYYDPAIYSAGNLTTNPHINVDAGIAWGPSQVGMLWWDLSTTKFINSYDSELLYRSANWGTLFPGASVDVYEWVGTTLKPTEWNAQADTDAGLTSGISGTTLYDGTVYAESVRYDNISKSYKRTYYYWVKNKKTVPNLQSRQLSAVEVSNLIGNPRGQGYQYIIFTGTNSFSLVNIKPLLEDADVVLSVEYWLKDRSEQNIHTQWALLSNNSDSNIPTTIEQKWFDSLCGKDVAGRMVPDINLPVKLKYGIENRPRQSLFVNRLEALKQLVERANRELIKYQIVESRDVSAFEKYDAPPTISSSLYDTVIDTDSELVYAPVSSFTTPVVSATIVDGTITSIEIISKGIGYITAPTITAVGDGIGAVLKSYINKKGEITSIEVVSGGKGYVPGSTTVLVRSFCVLILQDALADNSWSIASYDATNKIWSRVKSKAYDVRQYWSYADWYATGFNQFTTVDYSIDTFSELNNITAEIGDLIKVRNSNSGNWTILEKFNNSIAIDWTQSYRVVGSQSGTIQLKSDLYLLTDTIYGFDGSLYDTNVYDNAASQELRIILTAFKDNIFIDDLKSVYLELFFTCIRYALSEQTYLDWVFKTSFVKAQHNIGSLKQSPTYIAENLSSYQSYIDEVKPYRTKVREYVSSYDGLDTSSLSVSDFDLPPVYALGLTTPVAVSIINGTPVANTDILNSYPWKHWLDNLGYELLSIKIVNQGNGYTTEPKVDIISDSGSGAVAKAFIANGKVIRISVLKPGSGYLSAPEIRINGGNTTEATAVAYIGGGVVRSSAIKIKFDRIVSNYFITQLTEVETFIAPGTKIQWPLKWSPDSRTGTVSVTINDIELLRDEYSLSSVTSTSNGYISYSGAIQFKTAPAKLAKIVVTYLKDWSLLNAADRIQHYYNPATGDLGKDLSQLMTGVDYGGVIVNGLDFIQAGGWGEAPYFTEKWDNIDPTFDDYIVSVVADTRTFTLPYKPAEGTEINIYHRKRKQVTTVSDGVRVRYAFDSYTKGSALKIVRNNFSAGATSAYTSHSTSLAGVTTLVVASTAGVSEGMRILGYGFNSTQVVLHVVNGTNLTISAPPSYTPVGDITFTNNLSANTRLYLTDTFGISKGDIVTMPDRTGVASSIITQGLNKWIIVDSTVGLVCGEKITFSTTAAYTNLGNFAPGTYYIAAISGSTKIKVSVLKGGEPVAMTNTTGTPTGLKFTINDRFNYNTKITTVESTYVVLDQIILVNIDPLTPLTFTKNLVTPVDYLIYDNGAIDLTVPAPLGSSLIISALDNAERIDDPAYNTVSTGDWNDLTSYMLGDVVTFNSIKYVATKTHTSSASFNTDLLAGSWRKFISSAVMEPFIADGNIAVITLPELLVIETGDEFIFRKSTSDGSIKPQENDYDTALSGGDLAYQTAAGIAAEDIIVDGDGFVTPTSSPATEEVVPGQVVDTLAIKVYDFPSSGSANIKVDTYIADGVNKLFTITQTPNSKQAVIVKVGSVVKDIGTHYTVDYVNNQVVFTTGNIPAAGNIVAVFSFGFSGNSILDIDYFIANGATSEFITKATYTTNFSGLVYVNGEPASVTFFKTDSRYESVNRVGLRFANPPAASALINYVIVASAAQTYSITKSENFTTVDGVNTYDLNNTYGNSLPIESSLFVRANQTVLTGPNNTYYTIGNNQYTYKVLAKKYKPFSVAVTDVKVYANGIELVSGVNYSVNFEGIDIVITEQTYNTYVNTPLIISIVRDVDFTFIPKTNSTPAKIKLNNSYNPGTKVEITSFFNHDILDIQKTAITITSDAVVDEGTVEFYDYKGITGGNITLDRSVKSEQYIFVTKNNLLLTPNVDFKVNLDKQSIKLLEEPTIDDVITLMTFSNNVIGQGISYMQFKDMLNRTHFKRLNKNKQTLLARSLNETDLKIILVDASTFESPSITNNKPGIIEIRGERIEYFTIELNQTTGYWELGQLHRATLGTGAPKLHLAGSVVIDIGPSETIPYKEVPLIEQITSDGTNIVKLSSIAPKLYSYTNPVTGITKELPSDIEVFVGGYKSKPWVGATDATAGVAYIVDDIVEIGSYTYRCITAHTSSKVFSNDIAYWSFFIGNIRLKKDSYSVHNVNNGPDSPAADVEFDADFTVDGTTPTITLKNPLEFGTRITVVKKTGIDWDGTTSIHNIDDKISRFIKDQPGIWYSSMKNLSVNEIRTNDSLGTTYDNIKITFDKG